MKNKKEAKVTLVVEAGGGRSEIPLDPTKSVADQINDEIKRLESKTTVAFDKVSRTMVVEFNGQKLDLPLETARSLAGQINEETKKFLSTQEGRSYEYFRVHG